MKTMRAVISDGYGEPDVLKIEETQLPALKAGQVRIRVEATSINRADIHQRRGNYPPPPGESQILGLEAAGTIESVGPAVSGWKPGDRVMSLVSGGGYAEYAAAYADHLIAIPDSVSFEEAACFCEAYITAYLNIFMVGGFNDSESLLVHGGGGGVGTAALQLCKTLMPGSKVILTASGGKVGRLKKMGADLAIDYGEEDFVQRIRDYTDNHGVDQILDHVGAGYLERNLKALAVGGRLVVIGVMGGAAAEINLAHLMIKRQRIIGSVLRARPVKEKAQIVSRFSLAVLPGFSDRSIVPVIYKTFPMEQVADAHRTMEENRHFGKIVLRIGSGSDE